MPAELPAEPRVLWEESVAASGLAGLAANERYVLVAERDIDDLQDVFRCLDAATGRTLWQVQQIGIGQLDYGNSPRATPCLLDETAIFLGAFGGLQCVRLADGELLWSHNLRDEFKVTAELPWGYCGSPLVCDNKVIVQAGGEQASLVAFDVATGNVVWKTPGAAPSYGSLIVATLGGKRQIVGHDVDSLGGWDVNTGERLWRLQPATPGDFNVPTPIALDGNLLVCTENNGARLYGFDANGKIDPQPKMLNAKLAPDMSTPVVVGQRVFCVNRFLFCLDLADNLREEYRQRDPALSEYAAVVADDQRLLIIGKGELLLTSADTDQFKLLSRLRIFADEEPLYSHPALVGNRLYIRGEHTLCCVGLW